MRSLKTKISKTCITYEITKRHHPRARAEVLAQQFETRRAWLGSSGRTAGRTRAAGSGRAAGRRRPSASRLGSGRAAGRRRPSTSRLGSGRAAGGTQRRKQVGSGRAAGASGRTTPGTTPATGVAGGLAAGPLGGGLARGRHLAAGPPASARNAGDAALGCSLGSLKDYRA